MVTVKPKRPPSIRQKRVAKLKVENLFREKPLTDGEIVAISGYGASMKKNPQVIMNSQGVQEELKTQGFTEENAKMVVEEIMLNKKVDANARLKATDQVFKVIGTYAPEKSATLNVNIEAQIPEEERNKLLSLLNDKAST